MARKSQTDVAVLAALSVQPMTGYVLRDEIRRTLGHFWNESFGQIYPTLAQLSAEGLVEKSFRGRDGVGSSTYHLTVAGRSQLVALLSIPPIPAPPRNGLLLRLFFGHTLGVDACRRLLTDARTQAEKQLACLQSARADAANGSNPEHERYFLITISAGEHTAQAMIAWANESLEALA